MSIHSYLQLLYLSEDGDVNTREAVHMNVVPVGTTEALQHLPKYFRIQQELLDNIRSNKWAPGDMVPSEADLCTHYQVSRGTIRRALGELNRMGLIARSPGKPTVVQSPKIPLLASGFRTDIAKKGMHPGTQVLAITTEKAPADIAQLLEVAPGAPLLLIRRIITADDIPIIVESVYATGVQSPITAEEVEATSLLHLVPEKCRTVITRAVETYEPIQLASQDARLLQSRIGALAIKDQAVLYDQASRPVYVSTALVRGDQARIVTEISFNVQPGTPS